MKQKNSNKTPTGTTVIDGTNMILGRLGSVVAKRILQNEKIEVINAEKIVITGNGDVIVKKFGKWLDMAPKGNPRKGPKFSRMPDKLVRRSIRGMVPWKQPKGKTAFKNLMVHIGVPTKLEGIVAERIESAQNTKEKGFMVVSELSKRLGAKW